MADTNDSLRKQRIKYDEAVVEAHPDIWRVEDVQHHDSAGGGGGGGGGEAGAERAPLLRRTTSGMNAGAAIAGAAAEGLSSGVCGVEGTYCQVHSPSLSLSLSLCLPSTNGPIVRLC